MLPLATILLDPPTTFMAGAIITAVPPRGKMIEWVMAFSDDRRPSYPVLPVANAARAAAPFVQSQGMFSVDGVVKGAMIRGIEL